MNSSAKPLTIAVTGLNANDNPGPGIGVARAIREGLGTGVKIIGLAYESLEPGIYMRDVIDRVFQIPYPTAGTSALRDRIEAIHSYEPLDLIIPNYDAELFNFIKLAPYLASMGIKTFLPDLDQLNARDKSNLSDFGGKNGIHVPESRAVNTLNDLLKAGEELNYPLVVKGRYYEAQIVHNSEAAVSAYHRLSAKWGLPVIAQQFINGTEINVAGLGDGTGTTISAVPMRKLYITDKGKAWAGITIEDEALVTLARKFVSATHWKGGFELEIMRDNDGKLYVLEINPRFPAWIYLSAAAGQNQPASLVTLALGEHIKPYDTYQAGKLFIRYSWDKIVDISQFQLFSAFGELS